MIENKNEFKKLINDFFTKFYSGDRTNIRQEYNDTFRDGDKKAREVLKYLKQVKANPARLGYISIGGADGSEIEYVLKNSGIEHGILLEYDRNYCNEVRKKGIEGLEIFEGDAWNNRQEVSELIKYWKKKGQIDGVVITAFSVFHELKFRSAREYDHITFLAMLIPQMPEAYFYCKEPTKIVEWHGRVKLSLSNWISPSDLFRFSDLLQKEFRDKHNEDFNTALIEHDDGVVMDSQLAGEVIKKLVYFISDASVSKLLIEVEECHTALDPDSFSNILAKVFDRDSTNHESKLSKRVTTSERFQTYYDQADIKVLPIDKDHTWTPSAFTKFTAHFRPKNDIQVNSGQKAFPSLPKLSRNPAQLIKNFYEKITVQEYEEAFNLLSPKFRRSKWNNDLEYFKDGYQNTDNILTVKSLEIENDGTYALHLVYYNEILEVFQHPVLSDLWHSRLKDLPSVVDSIENYKILLLNELQGNHEMIQNIPLINFFSANSVEETTWLSGIKYNKASKVFTKKLKAMSRAKYVHCINLDNGWYINDIRLVIHSSEPYL